MKVYLIGGLGADERIFQRLDLEPFETQFLDWIPFVKGESLSDYAHRMSAHYIPSDKDCVLIGVSFGGMLVSEMSQKLPKARCILISSAKHPIDLPRYFTTIKRIKLHRWLPIYRMGYSPLLPIIFGCSTKEEKSLLKAIIKDSPMDFMAWAIDAILHWKGSNSTRHPLCIHGTKDYIIPYKKQKGVQLINEAGHFMIYTHANEVSHFIRAYLNR